MGIVKKMLGWSGAGAGAVTLAITLIRIIAPEQRILSLSSIDFLCSWPTPALGARECVEAEMPHGQEHLPW